MLRPGSKNASCGKHHLPKQQNSTTAFQKSELLERQNFQRKEEKQ
jgi:hypothetical protein